MLKLRTDIAYSGAGGRLTQAGVEAIQGQFDATSVAVAEAATDITALGVRVTATESTLASTPWVGAGQQWQVVTGSRAVSTSYQNTTGRGIMVSWLGSAGSVLQVSTDNATWVDTNSSSFTLGNIIVPNTHYYRWNGGSLSFVSELR